MTVLEHIELATPDDIAAGLRLLGIGWEVRPESTASRNGDLYVWTYGQPKEDRGTDVMRRGVLYIGVDGGTNERTTIERNLRDGWHGHGLAIKRANAGVVVGTVTDLGPEAVEPALGADAQPPFASEVRLGLEQLDRDRHAGTLLAAAERIAVRFCMHMGVIGAAVNAQYASAWAVRPRLRPYDDLAFWAADHLKARANASN